MDTPTGRWADCRAGVCRHCRRISRRVKTGHSWHLGTVGVAGSIHTGIRCGGRSGTTCVCVCVCVLCVCMYVCMCVCTCVCVCACLLTVQTLQFKLIQATVNSLCTSLLIQGLLLH